MHFISTFEYWHWTSSDIKQKEKYCAKNIWNEELYKVKRIFLQHSYQELHSINTQIKYVKYVFLNLPQKEFLQYNVPYTGHINGYILKYVY
jgi:hypothetical protein